MLCIFECVGVRPKPRLHVIAGALYSFTWAIIIQCLLIIIVSWLVSFQSFHRLIWTMCKNVQNTKASIESIWIHSKTLHENVCVCSDFVFIGTHYCDMMNVFMVLGHKNVVVVVVINLEWSKLKYPLVRQQFHENKQCVAWWDLAKFLGRHKVKQFVKWIAKFASNTEINSPNNVK